MNVYSANLWFGLIAMLTSPVFAQIDQTDRHWEKVDCYGIGCDYMSFYRVSEDGIVWVYWRTDRATNWRRNMYFEDDEVRGYNCKNGKYILAMRYNDHHENITNGISGQLKFEAVTVVDSDKTPLAKSNLNYACEVLRNRN